jgi:hypothetical protein
MSAVDQTIALYGLKGAGQRIGLPLDASSRPSRRISPARCEAGQSSASRWMKCQRERRHG